MRTYVDSQRNCEDLAMNAVVHAIGQTTSHHSSKPLLYPVLEMPYATRWLGVELLLASHVRWLLPSPGGISGKRGGSAVTAKHLKARGGCVNWLHAFSPTLIQVAAQMRGMEQPSSSSQGSLVRSNAPKHSNTVKKEGLSNGARKSAPQRAAYANTASRRRLASAADNPDPNHHPRPTTEGVDTSRRLALPSKGNRIDKNASALRVTKATAHTSSLVTTASAAAKAPAHTPSLAATTSAGADSGAAPHHPMCYTSLLYGTMLLTEFRVLGLSLRDVGAVTPGPTGVPMIALLTPDEGAEVVSILSGDGWMIHRIKPHSNPNSNIPARFTLVYSKLEAFALHTRGCELVTFIDADVLVHRDPTPMFLRCPGFCAVMRHSDRFNSGVMVFKPSAKTHQALLDASNHTFSYTGGDQGLLNEIFSELPGAPMLPETPGAAGGYSAYPTQLGLGLGRLGAGYNTDMFLAVMSGRFSLPGGIDAVYLVHYTLLAVKPHDWWVRWLLPQFIKFNFLQKSFRLQPPPDDGGFRPFTLAAGALAVALGLRAAQSRGVLRCAMVRTSRWTCAALGVAPAVLFVAIIANTQPLAIPLKPFKSAWLVWFALSYGAALDAVLSMLPCWEGANRWLLMTTALGVGAAVGVWVNQTIRLGWMVVALLLLLAYSGREALALLRKATAEEVAD